MRVVQVFTTIAAVTVATACGTDTAAPPPRTTTTTSPSAADPYRNEPLIDHVTWNRTDRGEQLQVIPTHAGRVGTFPAAEARAWSEVVAAEPSADAPNMRDQFFCHWVYARIAAPNKPSWNLEPWRPNIGYQATTEAACNPGGAEE